MSSLPVLIGFDEFPVGYSLAGCPPAEPASASPTGNDSQQPTLPYNDFSANGNNPLNFVSQPKGALQFRRYPPPLTPLPTVALLFWLMRESPTLQVSPSISLWLHSYRSPASALGEIACGTGSEPTG